MEQFVTSAVNTPGSSLLSALLEVSILIKRVNFTMMLQIKSLKWKSFYLVCLLFFLDKAVRWIWEMGLKLQISAFFYFLIFEKVRLLCIHPVGRLVGWSTSPLIFSIYRGIKALYWPNVYHLIPNSTKSYWPSITKYQPALPHTDPVPPNTSQYQPILTQYHHISMSLNVPRNNVPRDNVPRDNVPRDNVPCNNVPRNNVLRDNVPREYCSSQ